VSKITALGRGLDGIIVAPTKMANPALLPSFRNLSGLLDAAKIFLNSHRAIVVALGKKGHIQIEAISGVCRETLVCAMKEFERSGINISMSVYRSVHAMCIMQVVKDKSWTAIKTLLYIGDCIPHDEGVDARDEEAAFIFASISGMMIRGLLRVEAEELVAASVDTLTIELYDDETCTLEDARNLHNSLPRDTFPQELQIDLEVLDAILDLEAVGEGKVRAALAKSRTATHGIYFPLRYMKFGQKLRKDAANYCQGLASVSLNTIKIKDLASKMQKVPAHAEWVDKNDSCRNLKCHQC
jgi:hypothetical protein